MDTQAQRCNGPEWFRAEIPGGAPGTALTGRPFFLGQLVAPWRDDNPQTASILRLRTAREWGADPAPFAWGATSNVFQAGGVVTNPTPVPNDRGTGTVQLLVRVSVGNQAAPAWRWVTMGGDMELGGLVWGREVSIYKHRWDGDPAPLFMLASLSPLGPGRGGGAPFPWRAETVVQTGPGPAGARTLIPPPAARFVELSCGTQTTMGIDFIDRDGVSTIGGFAWTQSANQVWPIPQRAGSLVLTTSGAANVTVIFDQGEG